MKTFKVGDRVTVKPGSTLPEVAPDLIFVVTDILVGLGPKSGPVYTISSKNGGTTISGFGFTADELLPAGKQYKCNLSKLLKSRG